MNKYNEKEVIALLQEPSRQREAFECIVNEYSEQLYWQIRHMVLSHDDAWLYRIALNECLTFLNREKANSHTSIDDADTEMLNQLEGDIYFDGNEGQKALLRAIHKLPEKQRIIFNLKYFKEMKYDEISEILGTSIGALKASYHHAVKKIEAFLEKHL